MAEIDDGGYTEIMSKHYPYDDGSGYRYETHVCARDGQPFIVITQGADHVRIDAEHWAALRDSIDAALNFVSSARSGGKSDG